MFLFYSININMISKIFMNIHEYSWILSLIENQIKFQIQFRFLSMCVILNPYINDKW
jgi:hypothetical protein